jgi:GNAT superfamily N-acetyltransferase
MVRIEENALSAVAFRDLFLSVGWEAPSLEQIEIALSNSLRTFVVIKEDKTIGMARLLGDYAMSYYIKDFAIRPEFQGKGIGRYLMKHIDASIRKEIKEGWSVSLELISSKGQESFYKKFEFEERPCEWDGAGMFKMIRK